MWLPATSGRPRAVQFHKKLLGMAADSTTHHCGASHHPPYTVFPINHTVFFSGSRTCQHPITAARHSSFDLEDYLSRHLFIDSEPQRLWSSLPRSAADHGASFPLTVTSAG